MTTCSRALRSSSRTRPITTDSGSSSARREISISTAESFRLDPKRGHSSVGRAPALQAGGHGFESRWLHPEKPRVCGAFLVAELAVGHPRVGVFYLRGPERGPRGPAMPSDEAVSTAP